MSISKFPRLFFLFLWTISLFIWIEFRLEFSVLLRSFIIFSLCWSPCVSTFACCPAHKFDCLPCARRFIASARLLYETQIRSKMERCSHTWGGVLSSTVSLDRVQREAIRSIIDLQSTFAFPSLDSFLAIFFLLLFLSEFASAVPLSVTFSGSSRIQATIHSYWVLISSCRASVFQSLLSGM